MSRQISTHESRSRISGGLEDISLETWSRLSGGVVFEDIRGREGEANIDMSTRDRRATTLGQSGCDQSKRKLSMQNQHDRGATENHITFCNDIEEREDVFQKKI